MIKTSQLFTALRQNVGINQAYGQVQNVELETSTRTTRYWIAQTRGYILELATNANDNIIDIQAKQFSI